eukprot:Clim_evm66s218 gene=Clim_evmTU66s218
MPPKKGKKGAEPEEKPILGRFGTSLKMGVVGLPNVGKSTFFNVLTKSEIAAENYPFCTIDANESRAPVPDERFNWLCEHWKPPSKIPAFLFVTDIAGLVKGAAEGQGLGNNFLSHIKAVDGIFHMVRAFDDPDVTHVEGEVDPIRDMTIIHEELRLKDAEFLTNEVGRQEKTVARSSDKQAKANFEILQKIHKFVVEDEKDARSGDWNGKEIEVLNELQLLTAKPMVYLVNLTQKDYLRQKNKWLPKIKEFVDSRMNPPDVIIPFSAQFELNLFDMPDDERAKYLDEVKVPTLLPKIIVQGFKTLNLQYFFTAGPDEVRAWTIRKGSKSPEAAGKIHSDMEKGFIMAEVMHYEDYKTAGSEAAVKAAGKYMQKGKDYIVQDGDIIVYKFNVTTQPKKK